jgi:hypothetical protein
MARGGEIVVRESSGSATNPTLTRSNYAEWGMVMRVQLQAQRLWDVIEYGADDDQDDRAALAALLRAVPPELVRTLAVKDCAKTAWEMIKTMRMGCERVREAKAQTRRHEFDDLRFRSGESVEDFALRLTGIMNDLELLGDPISEYKAILKFLRVVPRKYRPMVMAIEQVVNLKELTIEELCGRLATAEEGYDLDNATDGVSKLYLTEEEWAARSKQHGDDSGNKSSPSRSRKVEIRAVATLAAPACGARVTAGTAESQVTGPWSAVRKSATRSAMITRLMLRRLRKMLPACFLLWSMARMRLM